MGLFRKSKPELSLNGDGQPHAKVNLDRNLCKSIDELYGVCEGILADHVLVPSEINFLANWFTRCNNLIGEWPANVIAAKVAEILDDGEVSKTEAEELQVFIAKVIGGVPNDFETHATRLPCEDDSVPVEFFGRTFCFTGKFSFGERKACQEATIRQGGKIQESVTMNLNYLVIGSLASRDWIHASHGRKIESVLKFKDKGAPTVIVSEEHWLASLNATK